MFHFYIQTTYPDFKVQWRKHVKVLQNAEMERREHQVKMWNYLFGDCMYLLQQIWPKYEHR